jgi:hypothetical protein
MDLRQIAAQTIAEDIGVSVALAWDSIAMWDIVPYTRNGEVQAFAIIDGTEIHFSVLPAFRGKLIQRHRISEFLQPIFEHHGFLTTRTAVGQDASFIERLGFTKTWSDGEIDYHILTALPFLKKDK